MTVRACFLLLSTLLVACDGRSGHRVVHQLGKVRPLRPPARPDTVYFSVCSRTATATTVRGVVPGVTAGQEEIVAAYRRRFARSEGPVLVLHTLGNRVITTAAGNSQRVVYQPFHDTLRVNEATAFGASVNLLEVLTFH